MSATPGNSSPAVVLVGGGAAARARSRTASLPARAARRGSRPAVRRARTCGATTRRTRRRGAAPRARRRRRPRSPPSCSSRAEPSASSSANGPGTPGGGTGRPSSALTASKTTPSHGLRSRGAPDRDRGAAAGPQHAADLARRPRGVGHEHQPLAAQHDVVGARRARRSPRGRSTRVLTFVEARAPRRARAAIAVISGATSESTTSPPGATRSAAARPRPPGPQASSSTRSPGAGAVSSSSRSATRRRARRRRRRARPTPRRRPTPTCA